MSTLRFVDDMPRAHPRLYRLYCKFIMSDVIQIRINFGRSGVLRVFFPCLGIFSVTMLSSHSSI